MQGQTLERSILLYSPIPRELVPESLAFGGLKQNGRVPLPLWRFYQPKRPAAPKRRLRARARLLVQGIDAAPAAAQTETGFDAGRVAPCVQADRQSTVIVDVRFACESKRAVIKCRFLPRNLV